MQKTGFWSGIGGFFVFAIFVIIIWLANFWVMPSVFSKPTEAGTAGDMFGGVTALFSGLAFAGLISTLLMQRKELEYQREELKLTRGEFSMQRFENTLFGLIKIFNDHVASMEYIQHSYAGMDRKTSSITGRHVLKFYARKLDFSETPNLDDKIVLYLDLYKKLFESDLGPYYRLLYNTIRHIESFDYPEKDAAEIELIKLKYSKIVRAYLGSAEVKLLAFNCASKHGKEFRPWVIKHQLLKHLNPADAENNPDLVKLYGSDAFGGRYTAFNI